MPVFDATLQNSRPCLHWTGVGDVRASLLLHNGLAHSMDMGTVTVHTVDAPGAEANFVGEAVLLPLKPGELTLLAFAKETRVSVAKETKAVQHPAHKGACDCGSPTSPLAPCCTACVQSNSWTRRAICASPPLPLVSARCLAQ